jgi:hypothetical protein
VPRRAVIAAATLALAALLFIGALPASGASPPGRIVVILTPYMTWDDVLTGPMPSTRSLAESGVVGDMNVRSGAVGGGGATLSKGALMLSAGASALSDGRALEAFGASETVDGFAARDMYERLYGMPPRDAAIVYLGSAQQAASNAETTLDNRIGALGDAIGEAGFPTAAVGNSDPGLGIPAELCARPAAIVAADRHGLVRFGDVSPSLLTTDAVAPYGVRTDPTKLDEAYNAAVALGARFIVVDPGDLARANDLRSSATTGAAETARLRALRTTDRVVGMVRRDLGPSDLLVVLAPLVPEVVDVPADLAPVILGGAGMPSSSLVRVASTRRDGICTVMDVSATLVRLAGATPPVEMVGSLIGGVPAGGLEERLGTLRRMNDTAVAVETIRAAAANTYITVTILLLLASALAVTRDGLLVPARLRATLRALLLLSLSFAPAGLLMFAVWRWPSTPLAAAGLLVGTAVAIWGVVLLASRGRSEGFPLLLLTAIATLVLVVDQWLGAPLSFTGVFGYSPLFGARYYGIGNEMAGMLLGCSLVALALALDLYRDRPWAAPIRRYGWPLAGAVVVASTAAPFFGANVGAIAWMTVGFLVGWLQLHGRRVFTWRNVAIAIALVVLLLLAASAADLLGSGSATHLGRAIAGAEQGGPASFLALIARKAETNMRVLGRTNWTWLLVALLVVLGYMRWRPRGEFASMLRAYPALSAAMAASLAAGAAGYFTEDSGIIIPALAMLPVGVAALSLMMSRVGVREGDGG